MYILCGSPPKKHIKLLFKLQTNYRRIAKNTVMLYMRLIVVMLISLYTVRMVLNILGAEDYGIYNVVAGLVTMFGFLSNTLSLGTQRFLSLEIGRDNNEQLNRVFNVSIVIYLLIAVVIAVFAESIGLWFMNNKISLPAERMEAARWIYQCAILSFICSVLATPCLAMVLAHEDMNIYAIISIIRAILDLASVIVLQFIPWDKLKLYGLLISMIAFIYVLMYWIMCAIKYPGCRFRFYWEKKLFKEMTVYNSWMLFGSVSGVAKLQIINILLNQFFNPAVVAARSIAVSVNNAVSSFFNSFSLALRPPIVKCYAAWENGKMLSLIFLGTKGIYFLTYIFTLPLLLEMPIVLSLWLKNVPEYAVVFTRLVLVELLFDSICHPMNTVMMATEKIGLFELVAEGALLFNLPAAWIALQLGAPPYSVMIASIGVRFTSFVLRILIINQFVDFPVLIFLRTVLARIGIVAVLSAIIPFFVFRTMKYGFFRLCLVTGISIISLGVCMYFVGLEKVERKRLNKTVIDKYSHRLSIRRKS
jgi:O-antigen/teichoic acid export membrane protein